MSEYLNFWKKKRVLITGGAGAIGSNLTKKISELGADLVIVLDDLSASYEWNIPSASNVLFVKGSVVDDISLKRVFQENPTHVFHLAAFFANQNSVDFPEKDINVNGMGTLK
ncbi:MAG: GDP-mannose 4,6-dehydratase, partial [Promethearchaeota archaeon]